MYSLSSVLGFQHRIRTPIGYAPGINSVLHLGYGANSKITGDTITQSLDIIRDGATATVSSQIKNKEVSRTIDSLTKMETKAKTNSDGLTSAKESFQTIKDNIERIKGIVITAQVGGYLTDDELDAQQIIINDLVSEIDDLVENTTIDAKKVFDGTYETRITNGLELNNYFDINFTNGGGSSLNLRTDSNAEGSLGANATVNLSQISISENIESIGGVTGLANSDTVSDVEKMTENLTIMEAILNSNSNRIKNELSRITDKKTKALDKFFATLNTTNGGKNSVVQDSAFFYHPSPLPITTLANYDGTFLGNILGSGVQEANPIAASSLLP